MNLTPSVKKDKIFVVFFCVHDIEWCMIISTFLHIKREGVQTHKARLTVNPASHTVNLSAFQADVRLHDIFYFICFAF